MEPVIFKVTFDWLADENSAPLERSAGQDVPLQAVPAPENVGDGSIEILNLSLGMSIGRVAHRFRPELSERMVPFADITADITGSVLFLQSARIGRVIIRERSIGTDLIFSRGVDFFEHVEYLNFSPLLDASETIEWTTLSVSRSTLSLLMGEKVALSLMAKLGIENVFSACTWHVPLYISAILHSAFSTQLTGEVRRQYAQAKVLEYLCMLANHVAVDAGKARNSSRRNLIDQLHDELLQQEGKIPALGELARQLGTSVKTLNDEFKQAFGKPIFSYMIDHRLNEAQTALLETDIAMKVLAARLGYSHVNHFINAFSKKFGYPPGSLRRTG